MKNDIEPDLFLSGQCCGSTIGSPYWTALEILKSNKCDYKSDIWNLGIAAIDLAMGRPPHFDESTLKVLLMIMKEDAPKLPFDDDNKHWSMEFRDFISSCCEKEVVKRATAKELLQHRWIKEGGDNVKVLADGVRKSLPAIIEWRRKQRQKMEMEMEMEAEFIFDDDDGYDNVYKSGGDGSDETMIIIGD